MKWTKNALQLSSFSQVLQLHLYKWKLHLIIFIDLLSDDNLAISEQENIIQVKLKTSIAAPVITCSDGSEEWLTLDRRSDFGGKVTLSFKATTNTTYKDHSATITISSPLVTTPVSVDVNQKQTDAIIPEHDVLMCDLTARKISFNVKYNVDYNISIAQGAEWITEQSVSQPQSGDDGLKTVVLTYNLSNAPETRGGIIRITDSANSKYDIAVVQKDPNVELINIPDEDLRTLLVKKRLGSRISRFSMHHFRSRTQRYFIIK